MDEKNEFKTTFYVTTTPPDTYTALTGVVSPKTEKESILQEAERIINGRRQDDYGPPEMNLQRIADLWTVYLDHLPEEDEVLSPKHVAEMMILLKVARNMENTTRDNLVDACGYAALIAKVEGFDE